MTVMRGAGRPTTGYRLANGDKVPSVTTITGRFKDSGGLIHWAWKQGTEGVDYRAKRDAAADAGSIAHQWIEDTLHGDERTEFPDAKAEDLAQAEIGFTAFQEWRVFMQLDVLETEVPLVSEVYKFGGTLDCVAAFYRLGQPTRVLLDWKTSGGSYPDYIAQVAAYRQLLRERDGNKAPGQAFLLRLGKEHADFHFHSYPSSVLDLGWRWFMRAREMYEIDRDLKRVAA